MRKLQQKFKKQKIVIANSVGRDRQGNQYIHFPSRWTAKMGKLRDFTFYPYQLAYLSSILKRDTRHNVKMLDGNLLGLNPSEYIELISKEKPDWLIMETSSPVYKLDLDVAKAIKEKFGTKLIFAGQHPTASPKEVLEDGIDYACIGEFEATVLDIINGKKADTILGLHPNGYRPLLDVNNLPFPEDNDICRLDYDHIGGCDYREIEFFASRGCPFDCSFCVAGTVYYQRVNWRPRKVESIIAEIKYLRQKYPQMEGIFFDEEDHAVSKNFIMGLTSSIIENNLNDLHYNAMCGYINMDREMLTAMKKAGYYKIRVGIETASDKVAKQALGKRVNQGKLLEVLSIGKELGIKMYGTFTFGAWGSTKKEDMKTLDLIRTLVDKELLYDFQRSINTPLPGTPFYKWAKENNRFLDNNPDHLDGGHAIVRLPNYRPEDLMKIYKECGRIYVRSQLKRRKWELLLRSLKRQGLAYTLQKTFTVAKLAYLPAN